MRRKGLGKAVDASKAPDFHGLQSPKDKRSMSSSVTQMRYSHFLHMTIPLIFCLLPQP
jgi:hypothetical protein